MVKKIVKDSSGASDASTKATPRPDLAGSVKDSAQQIWLAGLGAFSKAQAEGGKVFDALVKQGMELQRKTQTVAEEKFSEASGRMASMANDISSRATGQWDKLESIFEDRVAKALNRLGVPSSKDLDQLTAKLNELNASVMALKGAPARSVRRVAPAKAPAKRTGRKVA
jgi:poly(hydroxyalkanoate) granule-associated protein